MTKGALRPAWMQAEGNPTPGDAPEKLLDVDQLAKFLRVKPGWVLERTRARSRAPIPHYRLGAGKGSYIRFRMSDVERWLSDRRKV